MQNCFWEESKPDSDSQIAIFADRTGSAIDFTSLSRYSTRPQIVSDMLIKNYAGDFAEASLSKNKETHHMSLCMRASVVRMTKRPMEIDITHRQIGPTTRFMIC